MKILYIGGGYVGACSAAVSADSGHNVLVYDINRELVAKLSANDIELIESALFEKGLSEILLRNRPRIKFTSEPDEVKRFVDEAEAVFMCLPTPEKDGSGESNLSFYHKAANELGAHLAKRNSGEQSQYVLIINKSTLPIGTLSKAEEIMKDLGVKNFGIGSNPEFLVEGKAIQGSINPQRVVVGAWKEDDFRIFRRLYSRFHESPNVSYLEVNPEEAEAGKLLANYILFSRLANCFDVIGRTCEKFNQIHFENIRKILVSDSRIGDWGFYDSLYAGGSCLIKDARSLLYQLKLKGAQADLIDNTLAANTRQLGSFMERAENELAFGWTDKTVALLGLAFKRDTNDMRNSAAIGVAEFLLAKQAAEIRVFDPVASPNFLKYFNRRQDIKSLVSADSEQAALRGADAVIIAADWPQFRETAELIKNSMAPGALIMDGRRMLQHKYQALARAGYNIIAVGSPVIKSDANTI